MAETRAFDGPAAPPGTRGAEWLAAPALAALFGALYLALLQERFYGDGPGLVDFLITGRGRGYYNVLFVPICRLVHDTFGGDPLRVTHVVSAVSGALGVGLAWPVLRALGAGVERTAIGCALLAVSPLVLFFSTTSEVHALHFGAVSAGAAVTLYAPWSRPALALALAALVMPLLYWTHVTAVLLGPGWVLLVQHARARAARPFAWRTLVLVVGPVLLAALLFAVASANAYRTGGWTLDTSGITEQIRDYYRPPRASSMVLTGWLVPLFLLVPLAARGALRRPRATWANAAALALVLPSLGFFLWWGVAERGAYFLGTAPFWAFLAARGLPEPGAPPAPSPAPARHRALAALLVVLQAALAVGVVLEHDRGWRPRDRVRMVREALGEEGVLVSATNWSVDVSHFLPGVLEAPLWDVVVRYAEAGTTPEQFAEVVAGEIETYLEQGPVALDRSYRRRADLYVVAARLPWLAALEEELARRVVVEPLDDPSWPMLRLRLRRE